MAVSISTLVLGGGLQADIAARLAPIIYARAEFFLSDNLIAAKIIKVPLKNVRALRALILKVV